MSEVYEIPTAPRNQTFRIALAGTEYQITQRYCAAAEAWLVNIDTVDGAAKIHGLMLVTGADLLSQFEHLGLGGAIVVQSDNDPDEVPSRETMGSTGHLYYLPT